MTARRGPGRALGATALCLLAGCAVPDSTPLLREDLARIRADLTRIEQAVQRSQAETKADLQRADRQTAQTLTEVQRSVAQLGTRLDELGRESGRVQGRLDELRRRVETLALQFDVAGDPPGARPALAPAPPAAPATPTAPLPGPPRPAAPPPVAAQAGGTRPGAPPPGATVPPSSTPAPAPAPPAAPAAGRQAADLYQTAYIDYTRGNYNLAIAAFKEFIRLYPNSDLAEKAQYWIGESHFSLARDLAARGDRDRATQEFERAVQEFRRVLITYPRGDRVPTALFKEALALVELKQPSLAEARLQYIVDQFPSTEEAAKAKEELGRLKAR